MLDRIGADILSRVAGQSTNVMARFFGDNLMELAVFAELGGSNLYQAYYFHKSGRFEPMLSSSGWSCHEPTSLNDHKHHPLPWRLDFDIDGISPNRVRHVRTVAGGGALSAAYSSESSFAVPLNTTDIVWTVAHSNFGKHVKVRSPDNERVDRDGPPWFASARSMSRYAATTPMKIRDGHSA